MEYRKENDMTVTWLGQAGFLLRTGDTTVLIDPYLSDSVGKVSPSCRQVVW